MVRQCTYPKRPRIAAWFKEKLMLAEAQEAGQILDEEQLAFLADPGISEALVLMANLSSCDPKVLSEDTNSSVPNDLLVLSLVEQMTDHVAHLDKENQTNKMVNESLTAELERYKERVTISVQRLNVDLNKREKLIDSQMDDLIRDRNVKLEAFQQEINTLKETLSNHVKEKESLSNTLTVFKTESKEKESKYIDKEIVLEIQNKELEFKCSTSRKGFCYYNIENELKELKGKHIVDTAVSKPNATIASGMFKLDIEPISRRLKNNRDAHEVYIEKTIENTDTLRGFVKRARTQNPGVKPTISASGSKHSGNTKNNMIMRPLCTNQKNKVEDHSRKVKSGLNKMNSISEPVSNALVKHFIRNDKFESIYGKVFSEIGYSWKPTGRTFTIVGNRRPKATRSVGSSSKVNIVESKTSNSKEPKQS
nr:hypothetical protein [Tanacetum cinerariifolium]